ncbi:MAG: hypothetical protein K8S23_16700 [Candidatus Cloacimonetes bacterium]|nr:hypothetical protein [Candidatus Cloacimonadota bacterium]
MVKKNRNLVVVVVAFLLIIGLLSADVPNLIGYQGRLTDNNGDPTNGNISITFSIYDVDSGGTALWSETQGSVDVDNGLFHVTLGSSTTLPEDLFNTSNHWLGIAVGTDAEMTPRTRIASVAYAQTDDDWVKIGNDICYEDGGVIIGSTRNQPVRDSEYCLTVNEATQIISNIINPYFNYAATDVTNYGDGSAIKAQSGDSLRATLEILNFGAGPTAEFTGNSDNYPIVTVTQNGDWYASFITGKTLFQAFTSQSSMKVENTGDGSAIEANADCDDKAAICGVNAGIGQGISAINTGNGPAIEAINDSDTEPTLKVTQNGDGAGIEVNSSGDHPTLIVKQNGTCDAVLIEGSTSIMGSVLITGDVEIIGNLSKSGGSFLIDHPFDPANKYLSHSFVESPDMMNVYNGNVILDNKGETVVELPHYFETLNMEFRYQLTPIGASAPNLYIAEKISGNKFKIAGGKSGLEVSWQVTGIRNDPYAKAHRIQVEKDKPAHEKGKYLHPKFYGQGEEKAMHYEEKMKMMSLRKK